METGNQSGRMILTALYLCMLGICFLVPIFFYFRWHCDERRNRRLRDLEIAGMTHAMNESHVQHREESRAARRKYREERRATFIQLFTPVRTVLTKENFIHCCEIDDNRDTTQNSTDEIDNNRTTEENETPQRSAKLQDGAEEQTPPDSCSESAKEGSRIEEGDADEFILVPKPGLPHGGAIYEFNTNTNSFLLANNPDETNIQQQDDIELREVPNECSICLCEYTLGSDIVRSSNPQCDHVFHTNCIEQWLMKQRDGPLCPCCRRDFVIDPFDFGSGETDDLEKGDSNHFVRSSDGIGNASTSTERRNLETSQIVDGVEETVIPGETDDLERGDSASTSTDRRYLEALEIANGDEEAAIAMFLA